MYTGRLINLCSDFSALSHRIEQETDPLEREWGKIRILRHQRDYLDFLSRLTGADQTTLVRTLDEFGSDEQFRREFGPRLREFEALTDIVHGDVRFHSLTIYTVVRLAQPQWIVETGVASGKSSALILLALHHNGLGNLISIDLPNPPGNVLPDGALTHTGGREMGWLVPRYLRQRWELLLGDSRQLLPEVIEKVPVVDVFLHDSLHTYDHVRFELDTVARRLRKGSVVLVDNVDLSGGAFEEFLVANHLEGYCFRDLGGARFRRERRGGSSV